MNERQEAEQKIRQEKQKEQTKLFLGLFQKPDGKEVLKKLSKMCNENEPTYVDQNPNGSAYKEGQRSIILGIRNIMNKTFKEKQGKAKI